MKYFGDDAAQLIANSQTDMENGSNGNKFTIFIYILFNHFKEIELKTCFVSAFFLSQEKNVLIKKNYSQWKITIMQFSPPF